MAFYPKSVGPLALRLLAVVWLLVWPKIGSASGTWSVISLPPKPGEVVTPGALAVDTAGSLYVAEMADAGHGRIQERDAKGNWSILATAGDAPGQVDDPRALAVDAVGNLFVVDGGHGIQERDAQGIWSVIATGGGDLGQVDVPLALAVDAAGNLYVGEGTGSPLSGTVQRVQKRDAQGRWSLIAESGTDLGQVWNPTALAADAAGSLYVADWNFGNPRIQKRDAQGSWSVIATQSALGLAVDAAGNLYVGGDGIQKRDAQGSWSAIAVGGTAPGQVSNPTALAVDTAGNLYVADTGNNRVLMYTPHP